MADGFLSMPRVRFLGKVRVALGQSDIEANGRTVGELLDRLGGRFGDPFRRLVGDGAALAEDAEVLVNGRNVVFLDGVQTVLDGGDELTIFMSGVRGFPGG